MSKNPEHEHEAHCESVDQEQEQPAYKKLMLQDQVSHLEGALAEATEKANANWDKVLRVTAELENARRRAEKDLADAHKYALNRFIDALLPILDSLEQALLNCKEGESQTTMREGIELTLKMFGDTLQKFGVRVLNPTGETFDPNTHEAMMTQESAEHAPNTIIMVIQKGYQMHDRLIRPARVIVAKGA